MGSTSQGIQHRLEKSAVLSQNGWFYEESSKMRNLKSLVSRTMHAKSMFVLRILEKLKPFSSEPKGSERLRSYNYGS